MEKYKIETLEKKAIWEGFVLSQKPKSFLQSWNWGEVNKLLGKRIFRLGIFKGGRLVGVCLAIEEKARRGSHLLIPGGPLFDWTEKPLVRFFLKKLRDLAKKEKVWFIRFRPELPDSEEARRLFLRSGFLPAPMHLHAENTLVLDITPKEEEILAKMRKTTRYLIKKSLTLNLLMEVTPDPGKTKILQRLQGETVARHRFVPFPKLLFDSQLMTFAKDNQALLFICRKGKTALAAAIIIFYGKIAYYHHSASSVKFRDLPFNYFLQWEIIQEAKRRGCKYYNLWGVAPTDDPRHRFAGVTLFKKGFGGERLDWLHAHDLPLSPFYWLTYVFETGRRILRRL